MDFFSFNKEMDMDKVMELLEGVFAKLLENNAKIRETFIAFPYSSYLKTSILDRLRPRKRTNPFQSMECLQVKRSKIKHFPFEELNESNFSDDKVKSSPARKKLYSPGVEEQFFFD